MTTWFVSVTRTTCGMLACYLIECTLFHDIVDYGKRQTPSECLIDGAAHAYRLFTGSHCYDNVETETVWLVLDVMYSLHR
jgi:hypothetical protein